MKSTYILYRQNLGVDLADMQLIIKFDKEFVFRYVLLIFSVNTHGLFLWKIKRCITITNVFWKLLDESGRKLNKILIDKSSGFYNRLMKSWLQDKDIQMYSTHNKGKSVVAVRFIRTLKSKIYKYMTSASKNAYIDNLADI